MSLSPTGQRTAGSRNRTVPLTEHSQARRSPSPRGGLWAGPARRSRQPHHLARGHPGNWLVGFVSTAPLGAVIAITTIPGAMAQPEPVIFMGQTLAAVASGGYFVVDR